MSGTTLSSNATTQQTLSSGNSPFTIATGVTLDVAGGPAVFNPAAPALNPVLVNKGTIIAGSTAQGDDIGVALVASGAGLTSLSNSGRIQAYGYGVSIEYSGAVANSVSIVNTGTIIATATAPGVSHESGVYFGGAVVGAVTNSGLISGPEGVFLLTNAAGTESVTNSSTGRITGTADENGIFYAIKIQDNNGALTGTGVIVNAGVINGLVDDAALNVSITNSGTITGGIFALGSGTLSLVGGETLTGGANFADGHDSSLSLPLSTIILAGTVGTVGELANPAAYTGFGGVTVTTGADWVIGTLGNTTAISGVSLVSDFGTLAENGQIGNAVFIDDSGTDTITGTVASSFTAAFGTLASPLAPNVLVLATSLASFGGTITGLSASDQIDIGEFGGTLPSNISITAGGTAGVIGAVKVTGTIGGAAKTFSLPSVTLAPGVTLGPELVGDQIFGRGEFNLESTGNGIALDIAETTVTLSGAGAYTLATGNTLAIASATDPNNAGEAIYTNFSPVNATTIGGPTIDIQGVLLDNSLDASSNEYAIQSRGAADATLFNTGVISAPNLFAVGLNDGLIVNAAGAAISGTGGVKIGNGALPSTIINSGTITGSGAEGIQFLATVGGFITNNSTGLILGGGTGGSLAETSIYIASGTITNAGTIAQGASAGYSVDFAGGAGNDELILDPGQVLHGIATASGSGNILMLAGSGNGTLADPGNYFGFESLVVAAGADWSLGTSAAAISISGISNINDFGTINLPGLVSGTSINMEGTVAGSAAVVDFTGTSTATKLYDFGGSDAVILGGGVIASPAAGTSFLNSYNTAAGILTVSEIGAGGSTLGVATIALQGASLSSAAFVDIAGPGGVTIELGSAPLTAGGSIYIDHSEQVTLSNTAAVDTIPVTFGSNGTSLALNVLDLNGTVSPGNTPYAGPISGFGLNDDIILGPAILPAVPFGAQVSLGFAGSLLTVGELNAAGSVIASTTLDVGAGYSLGSFVALLGTSGVNIETPATVDETKLTFSGTGSFESPNNYVGVLAPGNIIVPGETVFVSSGTASIAGTSPVVDNGTIIVSGAGAGLYDAAPFTGAGTLIIANAGQVTLANTLTASSGAIDFGGDGTLTIDGSLYPTGTISNFVAGDVINFAGLSFVSGASVTTAGSIATIHDGAQTFSITITPAGESFHLAQDGGGTELTVTPCFLAGTMILTDAGEVTVESLSIGDRVITRSGAAKPIKWLGRRSYRQPFMLGNADIIPVLICKGALGPNAPKRDLYVSPLHAMYLDDVLVPAGLLVNGRSIRHCPDFAEISYIHIELDRHDVIFAEGAAAETFVDCDSRMMFHNAAEFADLYPADCGEAWAFCAPRVEAGGTLRRIWRRLAARAGLAETGGGAPAEARLLGYIDQVAHDKISGWACLPDYPLEPVELDVLDGDGVIARVVANRYRPDLVKAGLGSGRHGFEVNFAHLLAPGRRHEISVRRAEGGALLGQSPVALAAKPGRKTVPSTASGGEKLALVLDARWPDPARDAGSRAILSHIEGLRALGYKVELLATQEIEQAPPGWLKGLAVGAPSVEALLRARGKSYALVYMHRLAVALPYAGLVRALCGAGTMTVYNIADLHHLRLQRQAEIEADPAIAWQARSVKAQELFAMRQVDAVITHSAEEAAYLATLASGINVHVVPWHVPPARACTPFARRHGVGFIGSYGHAPNLDAVRWLLAEIMPLVWRAQPEITCRIAGAGWPAAALPVRDARVLLDGAVPDLASVFDAVRLTVAPLRFGAGVKGKVLDSFAAGTPCAMTQTGAEGIGVSGELVGLVADSANELAALISRLHRDEAFNARMGAAGYGLIESRFGPAAMRDALAGALAERPALAWATAM